MAKFSKTQKKRRINTNSYFECNKRYKYGYKCDKIVKNKFEKYKLNLRNVQAQGIQKYGIAKAVDKLNYLASLSVFYVEIFDDSMRTIHSHDCDELGFVQEGTIQVFIWVNEKEYTMIEVTKGNLWFIPSGALHSLNNVGDTNAILRIAFNSVLPTNNDIAVLLNGLPQYIKNEYSESPHSLLKNFIGPNNSYFFAPYSNTEFNFKMSTNSPYLFKLEDSKPDYNDKSLGKILSVDKKKWPTLINTKFSIAHLYLNPNVSTQAFWYLNTDVVYVVYEGNADIYMTITGYNNNNNKISLKPEDYFFVPCASQHVIKNTSSTSPLKIVAFFSNDTHEYYSLNQGLLFFGDALIQNNLITNQLEPMKRSTYKTMKNVKNMLFHP
jgi:oxalate decarboxylase